MTTSEVNLPESDQSWKDEILKKWSKKAKSHDKKITDAVRNRLVTEYAGEVLYNESLRNYTSIRIGGFAEAVLIPKTVEEIKKIIQIAKEEEIPYHILGWGSNTLVKDAGIRGFVIYISPAFNKIFIQEDCGDEVLISAQAGVGISAFVNFCKENSLTGCEELIGIPGTMGGAMAMNAGARGIEISQIAEAIEVLNPDGEIRLIPHDKLEFEYRHFKIPRTHIILSGVFRLKKGNKEEIENRIKSYQKKRVDTQPLNYPNLGSIFKNPQPLKKSEVVVSAGKLIEEAGLKNIRVGGARVSEKHANFIINEKDATAKDVLILISLIKDKVKEFHGIVLETEIKVIGDEIAS